MQHRNIKQNKNSGIALLMTIMVLSVVVAVTLAIVELSLKQLQLSVDTKESEIAFHAANAGLECARYYRRFASTTFEGGANSVVINCMGQSSGSTKTATSSNGIDIYSGNGVAHRYARSVTWGGTGNRCSVIDMLVMVSSTSSSMSIRATGANTDLSTQFANYPTPTKTCPAGAKCTIVSVAGYNVACTPASNLTAAGTLKREVLLEF